MVQRSRQGPRVLRDTEAALARIAAGPEAARHPGEMDRDAYVAAVQLLADAAGLEDAFDIEPDGQDRWPEQVVSDVIAQRHQAGCRM